MTQAEADALLQMQKLFDSSDAISLVPGVDITRSLSSTDGKEHFLLDFWRGTIRISKFKYQTRARQTTVLARLDIDGSPHTNPDGQVMAGSHLHLYREGFEDKWAFPVPGGFTDPSDSQQTLLDFCGFCNIQAIPSTQAGLI